MSVALVTGAGGQVGSHIIERLLAEGWTVRALARDPARASRDLPAAVEIHHGDVLDLPSFSRAAQGTHVVFHAAANVMVSGWDAYRITNIEGTRNAIEAAGSTKARLLQVSSVAVYGPSARYDAAKRGEKTDESTVLAPLSEKAHYARSKRDSEELVLRAHREGKVWATAVRPDVIYGKRDRHFVPRMVTLLRFGAIPLLKGGRTTMAIVHAQNVAEGCVLAATNDIAGGKAYNLANDYDVSVRRFFELGGEGIGQRPRFVPMPMWLAEGAIRGVRTVSRVLTGSSLVNFAALSFLSEDNPFSSERAKRELRWSPSVTPEVGVPEAFIWALENKRARR